MNAQALSEVLVGRTPVGKWTDAATLRRMLVFSLVGSSGIIVDGGLTALALEVGVWYIIANGVGYVVAVSWNFALNYRITWGQPDGSVARMYFQYLMADVSLFGIRLGLVAGLVEWASWPPLLASLLAIVVVAAATFVVAEEVVFDAE